MFYSVMFYCDPISNVVVKCAVINRLQWLKQTILSQKMHIPSSRYRWVMTLNSRIPVLIESERETGQS